MTVTLPSPRASPDRETARRARKRIQKMAEAGSVTVAKGGMGRRWRDFRSRPQCRSGVGRVRGDGWLTAWVNDEQLEN